MKSDNPAVQASITGFWNLVAPHYEAGPGNTPARGSAAHRLWSELVARVLPPAPANVLDLGTGTGFMALQAAALGHNVVAIDLAVEMLAVARQQAAACGRSLQWEEGDAVEPHFAPCTFDAVTCRYLLWTLRNASIALANWRRTLKPGGRVIIIDGFREPQPAEELDPDDLFGRHYRPEVRAAIPFFGVQREELVTRALRDAGFENVQLSLLDQKYVEDSDEPMRPYVVTAVRSQYIAKANYDEVRITDR